MRLCILIIFLSTVPVLQVTNERVGDRREPDVIMRPCVKCMDPQSSCVSGCGYKRRVRLCIVLVLSFDLEPFFSLSDGTARGKVRAGRRICRFGNANVCCSP